jgi:hypothetical protein
MLSARKSYSLVAPEHALGPPQLLPAIPGRADPGQNLHDLDVAAADAAAVPIQQPPRCATRWIVERPPYGKLMIGAHRESRMPPLCLAGLGDSRHRWFSVRANVRQGHLN